MANKNTYAISVVVALVFAYTANKNNSVKNAMVPPFASTVNKNMHAKKNHATSIPH
jgi:uncharacterized membrane protein